MKTNGNDTMYPTTIDNWPDNDLVSEGLSKREYFAVSALKGLLADTGSFFPDQQGIGELAAQAAVKYADALIAELNKGQL